MINLKPLKIFAGIFTILSAVLVTSCCPICNDYSLMLFDQKYIRLNYAVQTLSNFTPYKDTKLTIAILNRGQTGFNELLNVIQKRRIVQSNEGDITQIFILYSGTGIRLGGLYATPEHLLGVMTSEKSESVAVMYENDIGSWIEDEKRNDLQGLSLLYLGIAVGLDLISDAYAIKESLVPVFNRLHEDFVKLFERAKKHGKPYHSDETK